MQLYDVNKTDDFNGTNGLELSIKKWESIVEALEGRLSQGDRNNMGWVLTKICGLCFEYDHDCRRCILFEADDKGQNIAEYCCQANVAASEAYDDYRYDNKPKKPALLAARNMLEKLKSLQ